MKKSDNKTQVISDIVKCHEENKIWWCASKWKKRANCGWVNREDPSEVSMTFELGAKWYEWISHIDLREEDSGERLKSAQRLYGRKDFRKRQRWGQKKPQNCRASNGEEWTRMVLFEPWATIYLWV